MRSRLVLTVSVVALWGCGKSVVIEPGDDAGPTGATVDVVGTWHDCSSTIIYGPDNSTTAINHREDGCTARGMYVVEDDIVTTTWSEPGCGFGPEARGRQIVRGEGGIATINPGNGRVNRRADGATTPHRLYRIVGNEDGLPSQTSVLSVVGDPADNEFGSGCYWSEDMMCGGLFSCSGSVVQWRIEDGMLNGSVACMGGCPCGAVISGPVASDGTITGEYRGVNCDRNYVGTFVATPL